MDHLSTRDLVLLVIRLFPRSRLQYVDREELARSLGLSFITIRKTLTELKKDGGIIKEKIPGSDIFSLTEDGMKSSDELMKDLNNFFFTPSAHNVPSSIKLVEVLKLINNPFFKGFLIKLFFSRDIFDLIETLKTFEMLEKETSIYNLFDKMEIFQRSTSMQDFIHSFMETTLFGMEDHDGMEIEDLKGKDVYSLLLEADMDVVKGNVNEGLAAYNSLVTMSDIPEDIWFMANIGIIKTNGRLGRRQEWEKVLNETREATKSSMAHGYLNQIEADLLGTAGELERAMALFERCIGTFRHYNYPIFLSIAYNNYGILMFNREMYDDAEKLWKKAKRNASQGGSSHMEAIALTNLASIMRSKGEISKAKRYLDRARKTYLSLNNFESLSALEYNVSLILLAEKEFEKSIEMFNRSMFKTYPLLSNDRREERLSFFRMEAEKFKYTPQEKGAKYDLVYISDP